MFSQYYNYKCKTVFEYSILLSKIIGIDKNKLWRKKKNLEDSLEWIIKHNLQDETNKINRKNLIRCFINDKDVFKYTTIYEDYLRKDTSNKFWLVNTNKLLKSYKGVDGLKTGMTDNAGYCMAVTAIRNNMRILAIVLGEKEGKVRNQETANLLDYGFNTYEAVTIKGKGEKVGEITFDKANPSKIDILVDEDITIIRNKGEDKKEYISEVKLDNLSLPIKKNDIIGKLLIKDNNEIVKEIVLKSNQDMEKRSFFDLWGNTLKSLFTGDLIS